MARAGGMPSCLHCHLLTFVSLQEPWRTARWTHLFKVPCCNLGGFGLAALAKAARPKPPRMQQGNLNRCVHLAVLHDMGVHQEASQYIQRVGSGSNDIDQLHQGHWRNIYQYGQDPRSGDFQATMATAAAIKICVAICPAYNASM